MIDENLPTFFLKNNSQSTNQSTIYHRQHGNEPEPAYNLRYLDPNLPTSRNRYGVALYDPYVPDVVYGEVAVIPEWTQPSLSADTIRANGGTVPPPEPILPTEFSIHLYNPDQQIVIKHQPKSWNKPARWEFEMPQRTFRVPSTSTLDQTQSDPAAADITPKLRFSWRKDGKLSKDLSCLLHGKSSTIPETRTKTREPDITVALFQGLRELTLYEPNLYRVEMEDFKGLEVVLLLAAVAIRDIFFGLAKEAFHIVAGAPPIGTSKPPAGVAPGRKSPATQSQPPAVAVANGRPSPPRLTIPQTQQSVPKPQPQPQPQPQAHPRQDAQAKKEAQRTAELLAAEKRAQEKAQRKRQSEIDAETKRLQKLYGQEEQQVRASAQANVNAHTPVPTPSSRPNLPPRHTGPSRPYSHHYSQSHSYMPPQQPQPQPQPQPRPPHQTRPSNVVPTFAGGPYMHGSAGVRLDPRAQSTTHLMQSKPQQARPQSTVGFYQAASGGLAPGARPQQQSQQTLAPKKSSFFGFMRNKEEGGEKQRNRLDKKRSSMF
ncbi:uncharacterized protein N7496_003397 [Penicillium cataractarum]|uniref:Uncharacterized protein n=1 Tax=Penicillium cataractarum TaxID=2100454 RepID=A0A9W9SNI2_9EURO|nr:uncharacterized protein N7496_003397 [Penicillium cataractarum]KAJ5380969.1 hypothetical protein N7496_003397 [Penicillium cataractarum]